MKLEQVPATGREKKDHLSPPLKVLSEFYEALNSKDLEKMEKNRAQTDESVMDNPVGGIKRGWEEIKSAYERIFSTPAQYHFEFYDYSYHEADEIFFVVGRERGEFRVGETVLELAFLAWLVLMPLDAVRFHWSQMPVWLKVIGAILLLCSFYLFFLTYRGNPYLSPAVRIQAERGQTVISTGPYRYVRHPLYAGVIPFVVGTTFLLGSWYGLLGLVTVVGIAFRAVREERVLQAELPVYDASEIPPHPVRLVAAIIGFVPMSSPDPRVTHVPSFTCIGIISGWIRLGSQGRKKVDRSIKRLSSQKFFFPIRECVLFHFLPEFSVRDPSSGLDLISSRRKDLPQSW